MQTRSIHRLQILLLALYIGAAILLWPGLPERIPMHFDLDGEVTDWAERSVLSWLGLPALAVVLTFFMHAEIYLVGTGTQTIGVAGSMIVILIPTAILLVMAFRMSRNVKRMVESAGGANE